MPGSLENQLAKLQFISISDADRLALQGFQTTLATHISPVLDRFYSYLSNSPELAGKFTGDHCVAAFKEAQTKHMLQMCNGLFDADYLHAANNLGMMYAKIELEPRCYIAGYAILLGELLRLAAMQCRESEEESQVLSAAITKATMLDMDYTLSVCNEAEKAAVSLTHIELLNRFELNVIQALDRIGLAAASIATAASTIDPPSSPRPILERSLAEKSQPAGPRSTDGQRTITIPSECATRSISNLTEAGKKMEHVVNLIHRIAGQTHLLALNATVEATRAGEAGKGFEVVANEVRSLATQTADASKAITAQVVVIQDATTESVDGLERIAKAVRQMNDMSTELVSAVKLPERTDRPDADTRPAATSGVNGQPSETLLNLAQELSRQAGELRLNVGAFIQSLRSHSGC